MRCIELFAGAGGLALGIALAGFRSLAVVERDRWACDTIRENQHRGYPLLSDWPLHEGDVREFDWSSIPAGLDLLAGGPPCQPFSMGGKHRAFDDGRDMFPTTVEIVRHLRPRAFILENVKGLTRSTFANYYQYILLQLEFPEIARKTHEDWFEHLLRLQKERISGRLHGGGCLTYNVVPTLVNAADHGVPQKRERVFIVGFRSDCGVKWSFPQATHGRDALLRDQWITGEYWDRHEIGCRSRPPIPERVRAHVLAIKEAIQEKKPVSDGLPWRTVRDALVGLPDPRAREAEDYPDHRFQSGARIYPGHTGSPLDQPAKTLKAGDHGVPGGENMLVHESGEVRYFTIRESARIQTFPDGYRFHGSWTETMRQLGNAVPVILARTVAASVAEKLIAAEMSNIVTPHSLRSRGAA
jgi:DNA (cytosine-5)-methyltransferase 1